MVLFIPWLSWPMLLFILFIVSFVYMTWNFRVFSKQGIVVPESRIPFLGTILPVMKKGILESGRGCLEKYGKTYGAYTGRNPTLLTVDPNIIREVFVKEHSSFPNRFVVKTADPINDLQLANIDNYDHWKYMRSTMSPAFSTGKLRRMQQQINKCAATYAQHLIKDSEDGKALEMKDYAGSFTMDVIASTAFGLDINTAEDRNNPFVKNAMSALALGIMNVIIIANFLCPALIPLLHFLGFRFIPRQSTEFFEDITNQTLDSRKDDGDDDRVDFLRLMMNAHNEEENKGKRAMTRTEIVAQGVLFFLAGYDTTASAISFLAYNLACNPDEQVKLIEEVKEVIMIIVIVIVVVIMIMILMIVIMVMMMMTMTMTMTMTITMTKTMTTTTMTKTKMKTKLMMMTIFLTMINNNSNSNDNYSNIT